MSERIKVPSWAPAVFIGGACLAGYIVMGYVFVPPWINLLPLAWILLGVIIGGLVRINMGVSYLSKILYYSSICSTLLLSATLLIDRFGDLHTPSTLSARAIHSYSSSLFSTASVSIDIDFPDGSKMRFPASASLFKEIPNSGAHGKVVVGRGLFGIQYLQGVEFEESVR
jgi:hypothetical protein